MDGRSGPHTGGEVRNERELAALALRRISPLKAEIKREEPTPTEIVDPVAHYKWSRRVRGLD